MPTEVLTQLRALRESIAESLRKDPRFLTLSALDKSIAEITGVLSTAGLLPPEPAAAPSTLHFNAPAGTAPAAPSAPAAPAAPPPPVSPAPSASYAPPPPPVSPPPAPSYASPPLQPMPRDLSSAAVPQPVAPPSPPPPAAPPPPPAAAPAASPAPASATSTGNGNGNGKKKKSILKPLIGAAAAIATVGAVAEIVHLSHGSLGKSAPEGDKPGDEPEKQDALASGAAAGNSGEAAATPGDDGVIPEGKASGYVPMAAKPDAPQYQPSVSVKFGKLPNKVDLRPLMTAVEDQGDTSSCVANAVAGAYEYWIKKATKQDDYNVSRLFVYYNARWRDGSQDKDDGSVIQLAMEGLSKFGACDEKVWPFDKNLVLKKPGSDSYENGSPWKVQDMAQVPLTLDAWKQALAEGKPIVFGIALFDSFDNCQNRGGVVEMPTPEDVARAKHSGHAMCAVGYSDTEKVFIVRNSWGKDWGDKGYCYMPYAYVLNPKFNDGDSWVFVPKVPMQPPREVWFDDTKPVTNDGRGVDFVIENFKIEDYKHVVFNFFDRVRKPFNSFVGHDFSEYVSFASRSLWTSMESFDYRTFLASTAALAGVVATTSAIASEFSSTTTTSSTEVSSHSESTEEHESDEESDESEDSEDDSDEDSDEDESSDDDEDSDEDSDEDDSSDEDEDSDEDSDEDDSSDEDEDSDEDSDEDDSSDEDENSDEDSDEDESSDEDEDSDEDSDEDESSDEDEDSDEDDSSDEDEDSDEDSDEDESSDEDDDEDSDEDDSDEDSDDDSDDGDGGDDDGGDDGDD